MHLQQGRRGAFPLYFQINHSVVFVVSLFHGLLMGSRASFRIQRHIALLMIIRSNSNWFTADISQPLSDSCSPCWVAMKQSQFSSPWGKERFRCAQQVINAVLTQCCHTGGKKKLWLGLGLSSCCCTARVMGQNQ